MKVFRIGLWLLLGFFTIRILTGGEVVVIDSFNLLMHEAGHLVFMPLGDTLRFLGGTFLQLLIPILCGGALVIQQDDWFGGTICGWWFSQNLVNVGRYMADAPHQRLYLVGGGIHDWAYLFGKWDVLEHAEAIGGVTQMLGSIGMIGWLVAACVILIIDKKISISS